MFDKTTILQHTTKYDGSLHYRFPLEIMYNDESALMAYRGPDVVMESYRGVITSQQHVLMVFFPDRYHNVAVMWEADWTPRMHYVNIATPATWNSHVITAVDLDIDVYRFAPGSGKPSSIELDDLDEFARHSEAFAYPESLVDRCRRETDAVVKLLEDGDGIFSFDVFEWRPGVGLGPIRFLQGS
ncbi:MAG: DUF402 domain-containing protein [Spirochaetaceae bacterium]|nr:MAG: DUF402 domain-containing protein [Spirochaetaceae bacterium]